MVFHAIAWSVIKKKFRAAKVPPHTKRHKNKRQLNMLYIIHNSYGTEKKIDMSCAMFFHMLKEYIPFPCAVVMNLSGFTFFLLLFLIVKGQRALKIRIACVFALIHLMHCIQRLNPWQNSARWILLFYPKVLVWVAGWILVTTGPRFHENTRYHSQ